ncbi:MAG TPA: hypothetical protein VHD62_19770 [Opitutaceae bacterium]|nr:hypothetical protein [Opitutaceae bacterium]
MKLTYQIEEKDLVATQRLGMRPRRWLAIVGAGLFVLLLLTCAFWIYEWISSGFSGNQLWWMGGLVVYISLVFFVWLPWRAKRTFRQQKTLHHPLTVEFTNDAFLVEAVHGSSRVPWTDFHKWKAAHDS